MVGGSAATAARRWVVRHPNAGDRAHDVRRQTVNLDWLQVAQATVSVWILVGPLSRGVFFRMLTEGKTAQERRRGAITVLVAVAAILYTSAIVGRELLELLGINLGAFGIAGGLVLAAMGFEMLSGHNTRAQGGDDVYEEPEEDDGYIVPFATPFIAGPGAITTVITLSAQGDDIGSIVTVLIAITIPLIALVVGMFKLGNLDISPKVMKVIGQVGGIFIATIGIQLILGGLASYIEGLG
jgi:multiple antibiotic resistance protein